MAKMLDRRLEVSEFKHQSRYDVHFRTTTFGKDMNTLTLTLLSYALNSTTAVCLQGWFWH